MNVTRIASVTSTQECYKKRTPRKIEQRTNLLVMDREVEQEKPNGKEKVSGVGCVGKRVTLSKLCTQCNIFKHRHTNNQHRTYLLHLVSCKYIKRRCGVEPAATLS